MHALILTPVYPHPGSPTEGLFNEQHALALSRGGVRVTVMVVKPWVPTVLAERWEPYRSLARLNRCEERDGMPVLFVRYLHIPRYRWPGLTVASTVRSILKTIRNREGQGAFDIIQVHSSWPVGVAAPMISDALRRPFVITLHLQDDPRLFHRGKAATLYRQMIQKASAVMLVGCPLKSFVRPWLDDDTGKTVRVVPNGIDLGAIQDALDETSSGHNDWGHLISVGNLWPVKGMDLNLRAVAQLQRMGAPWKSYTIIGDGPERRRLEKLARDLGIGDKVHFKGRLPHHETLRGLARSDIFSLPSWQEAFGVVYLEAMACGKPVIGCRGQGAEDIIRHERDGLLVEPKDAEGLAEALSRLLRDRAYARALGKSGMARAHEFTWDRNAAQYVDVYNRVCRDPQKEAVGSTCS